ncbi:hypothetical protein GN244_ATG08656 [Phytophthora infestans]|uniref:Uncharacterized protein n=1 Tax=Phytophthora infestans TaxID=4787 RepID=A0A833T9X6_PHYIN|nr:hypothetical protein GN244_ATG08656 [Phytophthora infestans]
MGHDGRTEKVLLAFAPLVDDDVTDRSAASHKSTSLRPVLRQTTHWDSTYTMIERVFAIKDFIDRTDDKLTELMNKLRALQHDLRDFNSASKKFYRDDNVTPLDVRDIFDALVERHPTVETNLSAKAAIVKSPAFEKACAELTAEQHDLLKEVADPASRHAKDEEDNADNHSGFADRARKKQRISLPTYGAVRFIPPTFSGGAPVQ